MKLKTYYQMVLISSSFFTSTNIFSTNKPISEIFLSAAKRGLLPIIEQTLIKNVNINTHDKKSKTALHHAIKYQREEIAKFLVKRGASLKVRDSNGLTPLHIAALYGSYELIKFLLQEGANCHARTDILNETALDLIDKRDSQDKTSETFRIKKLLKNWPKVIRKAKKQTSELRVAAIVTIKRGDNNSLLRRLPPDIAYIIAKEIQVSPKIEDAL